MTDMAKIPYNFLPGSSVREVTSLFLSLLVMGNWILPQTMMSYNVPLSGCCVICFSPLAPVMPNLLHPYNEDTEYWLIYLSTQPPSRVLPDLGSAVVEHPFFSNSLSVHSERNFKEFEVCCMNLSFLRCASNHQFTVAVFKMGTGMHMGIQCTGIN